MSIFFGSVLFMSLHYQFYGCYHHNLEFLVKISSLSGWLDIILVILVEVCFNIYPTTRTSSVVLHGAYAPLLGSLAIKCVCYNEILNAFLSRKK